MKQKGFTLFEILISMAIFSGIALIATMFSLDVLDFGIFLGDNIIAQQEIQLTTRMMIAEMRSMAQSANGAYLIESASQNAIVFYSDINGDGLTERIRYYLAGDTFYRGVISPSGTPVTYPAAEEKISEVVHNIYTAGGDIFSFYDLGFTGSQPALSFPVNIAAIRLIKIDLTADPNPLDPSSRINFSTAVNIRNL